MLSDTFRSLYGDLVEELDRYGAARDAGDFTAAVTSRDRLASIRHQLAATRAEFEG